MAIAFLRYPFLVRHFLTFLQFCDFPLLVRYLGFPFPGKTIVPKSLDFPTPSASIPIEGMSSSRIISTTLPLGIALVSLAFCYSTLVVIPFTLTILQS